MIPVIASFQLSGSVLACGVTGEKVVLFDNFYHYYELSLDGLQFTRNIKIDKNHDPHHKFSKSFAISKDGYAVAGFNRDSRGIVIKSESKLKMVTALEWHRADISQATFSPDGRYLATGGEDGRTIIYQLPEFKLLTTLLPRPDYIAGIAFNHNAKLLAVSCFDRSVLIFDLERHQEVAAFDTKEVVESLGFLADEGRLFYICKNGETGIFNLLRKEVEVSHRHFNQWLTCFALTEDKQYAYVGNKEEQLHLLRTSDNQPILSIKCTHVGISALFLDDGKLFVGYSDGYLEVIDLHQGASEFLESLNHGDFKRAKLIAEEKNLFLKTSHLYTSLLQEKWPGTLQQAIDLLATDKLEEAITLVDPFIEDPIRKEEFSHYAAQKESIALFLDAIASGAIQDAYKVADTTPEIKKISAYEKLEAQWNKSFEKAKKLLSSGTPAQNLSKAQDLLKPFVNVRSKKDQVSTLLRNADKYIAADEALRERNLTRYFQLGDRYPFIKDTEVYRKTYFATQQLFDRIPALEDAQEFEKALEILQMLMSFSPFKAIAIDRINLIKGKRSLIEAFVASNHKRVYELIEQDEKLKSLPESITLIQEFVQLNEHAYKLASKGRACEALDSLGHYLDITYWQDKIASTMKIAYLYEIKQAAATYAPSELNWKSSLEVYVDRFSKDDELIKVCEESNLKKYLDEIPRRGDVQGYKSRPYLSSAIIRANKNEELQGLS